MSCGQKAVQDAVTERLEPHHGTRLACACAKLQPHEEKAAAEEFFAGEAEWPEY